MANSTLLSLFQTTMQGMGVVTYGNPATVIANTNQDVTQTLALVNALGGDLNREFDWQYSRIQYIFEATAFSYTGTSTNGSTSLTSMSSIASLDATFIVTGSGVPQDTFVSSASGTTVTMNREATSSNTAATYTFSKVRFATPSDYDRMVDQSQWDTDRRWSMIGPVTPQQQAWLRAGFTTSAPRIRHWMQQGYFQIWPPLGEDENLEFWYQSKYWILATGATAVSKELYTVDTDTAIFPDPLMRAAIKLKYLEAKGLDTTAAYRDFTMQRDLAKAQDAGSPNLSMAPRPEAVLLGWSNIPDSGYNQ